MRVALLMLAAGVCGAQNTATLDELTARIEQSPTAALYSARGAAWVKLGEPMKALADFTRALEMSPDDVGVLLARANQFAATGNPKDALADRDRAVRLKPKLAAAHMDRADSYLQLGMPAEEMADRDETIRLAPDRPESWLARGRSYFLRGQYAKALADLNKVLELTPEDPEARLLLVRTLESIERAEVNGEAAPPPEPPPAEALEPVVSAASHHQRGRDLLNQGKYSQAIPELSEAIRMQPKFPLALNARGFAYYVMKKYSLALADFDLAISQDANYLNAYHNRAQARQASGDTQGAAQDTAKERELTEKSALKR